MPTLTFVGQIVRAPSLVGRRPATRYERTLEKAAALVIEIVE
jgi:hypothetical protein